MPTLVVIPRSSRFTFRMPPVLRSLFLGSCLLLTALPLAAQSLAEENIRLDYAQVLSVEPVYETLRAVKTETVCDSESRKPAEPEQKAEPGRWARMWRSVKGWFSDNDVEDASRSDGDDAGKPAKPRCRSVPAHKEFQRPIAYDVDYMYKGMKYRTRLPEDPGNRLRIRISVSPYLPGMADQGESQ